MCGAGQICEIKFPVQCRVTTRPTPSSDDEESDDEDVGTGAGPWAIAFFIAIWNLMLQAALFNYARKRRQAKTLLAIGQREVGGILKKLEVRGQGEDDGYFIEYSFPAGQRWVKTRDGGVTIDNDKVFGPLEVDVLYYDPDPANLHVRDGGT